MSRIHEAIKKLEQRARELAAKTGSDDAASQLESEVADALDASLEAASQPLVENPIVTRKVTWTPDPDRLVAFHNAGTSPVAEQFRTLRSRLTQMQAETQLKTLLLSSALPDEGKSFASANLALSLSLRDDTRVLLIDADMRWPRLHLLLGAPAEPGLSNLLAGTAAESDVMQSGPIEDLVFLPGGIRMTNAAELLANGKLPVLLSRFANEFDWIIIDSPALMPVSDGILLSAMCDASLLVVQAGKTPLDAASWAVNELRRKRLLGVLLNCASEGRSSSYYYGAYYTDRSGKGRKKEKRGEK
jgi:capsular exopolysaccharide synthesis family protein